MAGKAISPFDEAKYKALLEGLEISENMLSFIDENKDIRIDSQFYTQISKKNPKLIYRKIGEIVFSHIN